MILAYDGIITVFFVFLWLTCTFEALNGLSGGRIRKMDGKDPKLAEKLDHWMDREDSFRAILKLLLFVSAALIGALSYFTLKNNFSEEFTVRWGWFVIIAAVAVTSALCELIAHFILFRMDIFVLRVTLPLISVLSYSIFYPLTFVVDKINDATDDWHKKDDAEEKVSVEDEILSYVEGYNEDAESDLEEGEKQMIRGILEIGDMSVREIMTPRVDLDALPASASIVEAKKAFVESGHSRIPIFGRSIDEIRGILYAKDFIDEAHLAGKTLDKLMHKPIFIPETKEVAELLEEIKRSRNHFAVIIDEYGGTSGVVTFEDIIEEIVGEVHDEYDTEDDFEDIPQLLPDGSILVEARTLISDLNEIADTEIPEDDETDTIGGYICAEMGRIPREGEIFEQPNSFKAEIVSADKRKIKQIKLTILDEETDDE